MAKILRMPGISADAEEATLLEWTVAQGAEIKAGDALAIVETEKANVDIDAEEDGVLWRIMADAGDSVGVGSPIAVVLAPGEDGGDESAILGSLGLSSANGAASEPEAKETDDPGINVLGTVSVGQMEPEAEAETGAGSETTAGAAAPSGTGSATGQGAQRSRIFASPIARRLARDSGLPLEDLEGSGPDGRIVRADVEAAIARARQAKPQPPATREPGPVPAQAAASPAGGKAAERQDAEGGYTDTPHSGIRKAIANALTGSKRDIPHFYLSATCHVDALLELRSTINSSSSVRVSINDFFVKAVAKTLRDMPEMNVIWTAEAVRQFDAVDVSVAIATERGLVTPVLRSADSLTLTETSTRIRDFAARAAEGKLKQHELQGGTFTVTNLGMFDVENFTAIINPPQVGILAVGAVKKTPVVVNDQLEVASTVQVTVSADHRPVDGVLVAKWLQQLKKLVENPLLILT